MDRGRGRYAVTLPANAGSAATPVLSSRVRLRGWSITGLTATAENGGVDADFAAGAAGSVTLPVGASLTGIAISTASTAAVENGTVSISNVLGGPLNFAFTSPNGGNSMAVLDPPLLVPLQPSGGQITVAITAITSGAAGHIVAFYTLGQVQATVNFLDGAQLLAEATASIGQAASFDVGGNGLYVGTQLNITVNGGTVSGVAWVSDEGSDAGEDESWHAKPSNSLSPSQPAPQ